MGAPGAVVDETQADPPRTWLEAAQRRVEAELGLDPQAPVARFGSAF